MKKHKWSLLLLSLLIPLFILAGCNSKQNLKGKWNVQDSNHEYTTVTFTDKKVSVNGQEAEYKQVEVGFKNNVQYIVIEMEGKKYSIIFQENLNFDEEKKKLSPFFWANYEAVKHYKPKFRNKTTVESLENKALENKVSEDKPQETAPSNVKENDFK